jgi:hypothetical protein
VKGLPKDALIEKQVLYHTGRRHSDVDEDEEGDTDTVLSYPPIYSTGMNQSAFRLFFELLSYLTRIRWQNHSSKAIMKCDPKYRIFSVPQLLPR